MPSASTVKNYMKWLRDSGINVSNGQIGENFTTRGLDLGCLKIGDRLRVGGCVDRDHQG